MPSLILQSVILLVVTFAVFAFFGAALAGKKKRKARAAIFDEPMVLDAPEPEVRRPEPVRYLDAAAEHFTVGVVNPRPIDLDRPAYTPITTTTFETVAPKTPAAPLVPYAAEAIAAARAPEVMPSIIDDISPAKRLSSLAVMTPESVEAAVQQAGTGLEPLRLRAAQGAPDDLTVISGITEDQQRQLNDYGVYHFWQIAGWSPENVAWVASRVLSPHRIARENWMAQAARLAGLKG